VKFAVCAAVVVADGVYEEHVICQRVQDQFVEFVEILFGKVYIARLTF